MCCIIFLFALFVLFCMTQQKINVDELPVRPVQNPFNNAKMTQLRRALKTVRRNQRDLVSICWFLRRTMVKFEHKSRCAMRVLDMKYVEVLNLFKHVDSYLQSSQSDKALRKKENEWLQAKLDEVTIKEKRGRIRMQQLTDELQQLQQKCARQEAEIAKKEKRTQCFWRELIAVTKEHFQTLTVMRQKEDEREERERWWTTKCEELKVRLREEKKERGAGDEVCHFQDDRGATVYHFFRLHSSINIYVVFLSGGSPKKRVICSVVKENHMRTAQKLFSKLHLLDLQLYREYLFPKINKILLF